MSVDNRIVNMIFNNKDFEKGVATTTKSLNNLEKQLKMEGASKGLGDVNNSIKKIDMSALSNAVQTISSRFSTMGIIGTTALVNIANQAVNTGKRMISSLTIDPIKTGFQEYETKMQSIQTILTNTQHNGTTIDQVNAALSELNEYADKTIYNFAEMTKNIGTFTAAGVDLDSATSAIKGIANLAAGSGSTSQQASTAMYQLSQAIASGTVTLQDWNSVVNAGMGGKLFQDALKETGRAMGAIIDDTQSFRESISSDSGTGWLTSDILLATLQKFANDPSLLQAATQVKTFTALMDTMKETMQSGWSVTWEHIIGDKEEAAELFTSIHQGFESLVSPIADARNEMLKFWKENGGRQAIINGLSNSFNALLKIVKPIIREFREFFPKLSGEQLVKFSKSFESLTKTFDLSWAKINKIKTTFAGLFAVLKIGWEAVKTLGSMFGSLISKLLPVGGGLLDVTAGLGEWLVNLEKSIREMGLFNAISDKFNSALDFMSKGVGAVSKILKPFTQGLLTAVDALQAFVARAFEGVRPIEAIGKVFETTFNAIKKVVSTVLPYVKMVFGAFAYAVGEIFNYINDMLTTNPIGVQTVMNGGLIGVLILGFKKLIGSLRNLLKDFGGFGDSIKGVFESLSETIDSFAVKNKTEALVTIATAVAILSGALLVLSTIPADKIISSLGAVTTVMTELMLAITVLTKLDKIGFGNSFQIATSMIGIASAILILSAAMKSLSSIPWKNMIVGLGAVAVLMAELIVTSRLMEKNSKGMIKSSASLVIFATALNKLVPPVQSLGKLDTKTLTKGLGSIAVLLVELTAFLHLAKFDSISVKAGIGLTLVATALVKMAEGVSILGTLSVKQLIKGLGSIAALLGEIVVFSKLLSVSKGMIGASTAIVILAGGLNIMASALAKMGAIPMNNIGKGLLAIAGSLASITLCANLMPKGMVSKAVGITIMASALLIVGNAIKMMGSMSVEQIVKGLTTLTVVLAELAIVANVLRGTLSSAASLLLLSTAVVVLSGALAIMGSLSWSSILKGLVTLAGSLAILWVAGVAVGPLAPVLITLSGAIALLGAACLAVGAGLALFATGLTMLSVSGVAGVTALSTILKSLVLLLPSILASLAQGIVSMLDVFANSLDTLMGALTTVLTAILESIIAVIPKIIEVVLTLILEIAKALTEAVPKLTVYGGEMILGILNGILSFIGDIVIAGVTIVVSFINGIASKIGAVIDAAFNLIISFINGLADAIRNNAGAITSAALNLITALVSALTGFIGQIVNVGVDIVKGLWEGIKSMGEWVFNKVTGFVGDIVDGVKSFLGIHSPSRVFAEIGKFMDQGLVQGMDNYASEVDASAKGVAQGAVDTMSGVMSDIYSILDGPDAPVISPVMDLTNIQNGKSAIDDLLSDTTKVGAVVSKARASIIDNKSMGIKDVANPVSNDNSSHVSNTFNITGSNPQEIANEVSRRIQRDIERRNAVWA